MTISYATLKPDYAAILADVRITNPSVVNAAAQKVFAARDRYQQASLASGVPWFWIGATDYREDDCNPHAALGQGDPWNQVSTHVPRGKGPFHSWADAAQYYLQYDGVTRPPEPWNPTVMCFEWEKYNGFGVRNHGLRSGYILAGTNLYTHGMYVQDNVWSDSAVDHRAGTIPLVIALTQFDSTITPLTSPSAIKTYPDLTGTEWIQANLNKLLSLDPPLAVDGNYGRMTRRAVLLYQGSRGLAEDGIAGPITTAKMDEDLAKLGATDGKPA